MNEKRKKSDKQESDWADLLRAEVVKGSGSGWRQRHDVKSEHYLWELKGTDKASISLKAEWWEQLRKEAYKEGKDPAMHLELRGGNTIRRLVVLDENDFLILMELIGWRNG